MSKSLYDYAIEWQERLRNCQYAGEIYLTAEELNILAGEFAARGNNLKDRKDLYEVALLVLAVNCAYHYYDDEGFWKHFCTLIKCEDNIYEHDILGRTFENCLRFYGLLRTERSGPFRFVGAILEQCGVSRRYIAAMAHIIRDLRITAGRDYLFKISHYEFRRRIELLNCSRYLKNFLMDQSGWQFTLQVYHLLRQYEEGDITLEDLRELPGFQPDFWDEFTTNLGFTPHKPAKSRFSKYRPRLIFLPEENCVGLQFPFPEFAENVKLPPGIKGWQYPVTRLDSEEILSEEYAGHVIDEHGQVVTWRVRGWVPDGLPVLFDIRRGLIERNSLIQPGEYYLLVPSGYSITYAEQQLPGYVNLPGRWTYRAYKVRLNSGVSVPGYSVAEQKVAKGIEMSWMEPDKDRLRFCTTDYFDVFTGSLPDIYISDFSLIEKKILGLFYTLGDGVTRRIRNRQDLLEFHKEACRRAPVKGRIWLSNISRRWIDPGEHCPDGLNFCLLPDCHILFEERVYGFNEEAVLVLEGCPFCRLFFEGCRQLDNGGRHWAVPVNQNLANGTIVCGKVSAGIRIRVYRAGIYYLSGVRVRYISFSELEKENTFLLTGYPDALVQVCISGKEKQKRELQFDGHGLARLSSGDLLEIARKSGSQVCEVLLEYAGKTVSTGVVLIDLREIQERTYRGESCVITSSSAGNLEKIIRLCLDLISRPGRNLEINRLPRFCPDFDDWFTAMLACASVFDNAVITVGEENFDWESKVKNPRVREALRVYQERAAGITFEESITAEVEALPAVERWQQAMARVLRRGTLEGRIDILREWADEIRKRKGPFRCQIASQPGGNLLTRAWRFYLENETGGALDIINNMRDGSPLVDDLKNLLRLIIFLRLARIETARKVALEARLTTDIAQVYGIFCKALPGVTSPLSDFNLRVGLKVAAVLPLHGEDMVFLEKVAALETQMSEIVHYCRTSSDWLLLYAVINLLKPGPDRSYLASKLLALKDQIPASPEKEAIINQAMILSRGN